MIKRDHIKQPYITLLFQVVPDAVHFWEQALKIRRSEGPIKINQKCQNNQYFLSDNDPHQVMHIRAAILFKVGAILSKPDITT